MKAKIKNHLNIKFHGKRAVAVLAIFAMSFQICAPAARAVWNGLAEDTYSEVSVSYFPKQALSISSDKNEARLEWKNLNNSLTQDLTETAVLTDYNSDNSAALFLNPVESGTQNPSQENSDQPADTSTENTKAAEPEIQKPQGDVAPTSENFELNTFAGEIEPATIPPVTQDTVPETNEEPKIVEPSDALPQPENLSVQEEQTNGSSSSVSVFEEQKTEIPIEENKEEENKELSAPAVQEVPIVQEQVKQNTAPVLEFNGFTSTTESSSTPDEKFLESLALRVSAAWPSYPGAQIKLSYLDKEQAWQQVGVLDLEKAGSNQINKGYLSFELPLSLAESLASVPLRLEFISSGPLPAEAISLFSLDSVSVVASYKVPEEDVSQQEYQNFENQLLNPENFISMDISSKSMDLGLPGDLSDPITISHSGDSGQEKLAMMMVGPIGGNTAQRTGNSVVYENVFENTDVRYQILDNSLKEEIILKDSVHPSKFKYLMNLDKFDFEQTSPNKIEVYKKGKLSQPLYKQYTLTAPKMTDASGQISDQLVFKVKGNLLTLIPDSNWLKTAVYPVAVDPTVEITVLNVHSHPVKGEYWKVDFTTAGVSDLTITPADQATVDDMQFDSLFCGSEDRTSGVQILPGDVIYYPNWSCNDVATVSHLDLRTADHHLIFDFGGATAEAFNAAFVWDGGGGDANWTTALNWSSDTVPGSSDTATIDNTCAANCNPTINTTTSISGLVIYSATTTVTQQDGKALTVNGNFTLSNGTFIGGTGTTTVSNGALTISGGTFTAPTQLTLTGNFIKSGGTFNEGTGTVLFYPPWGANISFEIDGASAGTETFYNLNFNNAADNSTIWIGTGDTIITTGTLSLTRGNINTGLLDARGNVTQSSTFTGGSATLFFNNDALSQTFTLSGGTGLNLKLDSAADASDGLILNAASTLTGFEIVSGFGANTASTTYNGYGLTVGTYTQATGTFVAPSQLTITSSFTKTGGTFDEGTGTLMFYPAWGVSIPFNIDGGSASSETFYNVNFNSTADNTHIAIASGDTIIVNGTTTFAYGNVDTGLIDARGNVTQASIFTGGTATLFFNNDALSQTYTLNGGTGPNFKFDSFGDSSDGLILNSTSTLTGFEIASGFGANTASTTYNGYGLTVGTYTQAAGTFVAPTQLTITGNFAKTGGTIDEGTGTVVFSPSPWGANNSINIDGASAGSETFYNVNFTNCCDNSTIAIGSTDTLVVNGTLNLTKGNLNTGTVQAQGAVTVASTFGGGTTALVFSGSSDQNFNLTGATGSYNGDITINKSSGKVSLLSALLMDAASQDLLIQSGTLDLNGNNLTVNGGSGTLIVQSGGTLKLNGSETITANASNPQLQTGSTVEYAGGASYTLKDYTYSNLSITGAGTFTATTGPMTIGKNFYQSAGTFVASPATTTIGGNFTRDGGTFTHSSGTFLLNGTSQTLSGSTTFNNFNKSVVTADTLTFGAGNTTTIVGILTLGGESSNLLSLRSSSSGSYFYIDPQSTRSVQYLDVKDSYNSNAVVLNAASTGSQNSGNNVNWLFDPTFTQSDYKFYANNDAITPTSAIGNLSATTTIYSTTSPVRLRLNLTVNDNTLSALSQSFKIQVATSSLSWTDVGNPGSTSSSWSFYNNPSVASGTTLSALLLASSNVGGSYMESNPTALNPNTVNAGQKVEWDFALLAASATINQDYFFRMVKSDGTQLSTYNYAVIRFSSDNISPTPGSLSLTANSTSGITASISGASDAETGLAASPYIFYNLISVSNSLATSSASWYSGSLATNTLYSFVTSVSDASGNVATTATATAYTLSAVPSSTAASALSSSEISLSWDTNGNPAGTQFYAKNLTASSTTGWITSTSTSFTGLACGTSYDFAIKSRNGDGVESQYSATTTQATSACPTSPPAGGSGSSGGGGGVPSPVNPPVVEPPVQDNGCGLASMEKFTACYFNGKNFESLVSTTTVQNINFNWKDNSPNSKVNKNNFSAIWKGVFDFAKGGTYTFSMSSDDGSRLYIDGSLVIDQWKNQAVTTYEYTTELPAGTHSLEMQYFENTGKAQAVLSWKKAKNLPYNFTGVLSFSNINQSSANANVIFASAGIVPGANVTFTNLTTGKSITSSLGQGVTFDGLNSDTTYEVSAVVKYAGAIYSSIPNKSFTTLPERIVVQPPVVNPGPPDDTSQNPGATGGASGGSAGQNTSPITQAPPSAEGPSFTTIVESKITEVARNVSNLVTQASGNAEGIAAVVVRGTKTAVTVVKKTSSGIKEAAKSTGAAAKVGTAAIAPTTLALQYALTTYGYSLSIGGASDFWYYLVRLFYAILTLFGLRAKRRPWGVVYDSKNKQPLDPVLVELKDAKTGKIVDKAVTDLYGKFGFLDKLGEYTISVRKTNYSFPSKIVTGSTDGIFEKVYHGGVLLIGQGTELLTPNIPMDQLAYDWNQEDKKRIVKFNHRTENIIHWILQLTFWAGFVWVIIALLSHPTFVNLGFVAVYVIMAMFKKFIPDNKLLGVIVSKARQASGLYLELSPQRIPAVVVGKAITNQAGKFFLKATPGEYILRVKDIGGTSVTLLKEQQVKIGPQGVYNKEIEI